MSFTIQMNAATLATDTSWAAKGIHKGQYLPILGMAHIQVTETGLRLRTTDYDQWREVTVPADSGVADGPSVLVDPVKLATFLKGAKGDAIVTVGDTGVQVVIGSRTVSVPAFTGDVGDWPMFPVFTSDSLAVMDTATLKRGVTSAGTDDTLPMLTGVRFEDGVMATTDRFRLSAITYAADGFTALVPSSLLRPFTTGKGDVTVELMCEHVRVLSRDGKSIIGRVLDAQFPKWRRLIPDSNNAELLTFSVHRKDLLAALSNDKVVLELSGDGTMLVSGSEHHDDGVSVSQTIAASGDGPVTAAFNTGYLSSLLKAMTADEIELQFTTPTRRLVLHRPATICTYSMPIGLPS